MTSLPKRSRQEGKKEKEGKESSKSNGVSD